MSLSVLPGLVGRLVHATHSHAGSDCVQSRVQLQLFLSLVQINRYTPALLNSGDSFLLPWGLKLRAIECNSHGGEFLGLAEGTRLEGAFFFTDMPGDVEGIALAIAEPVDNGTTVAAFFVDSLFEGLGFTPISL